jgi:hypothetical protein
MSTLISGPMNVTAGEQLTASRTQIVTVPFGPYEVALRVTEEGRLLDVQGVRITRDFRSTRQKLDGAGYQDVEEFYQE